MALSIGLYTAAAGDDLPTSPLTDAFAVPCKCCYYTFMGASGLVTKKAGSSTFLSPLFGETADCVPPATEVAVVAIILRILIYIRINNFN